MKRAGTPTTNKMYFYERFASDFDSVVNMYDTNKRLQVIFDELLPANLKGRKLLDAGCGTGWFSQVAAERGATVTSMDVGKGLLKQVAKKCQTNRVVGSIMEMPFQDNSFDIVISPEVIEHIPDPFKAIQECFRVVKPGGVVVLTTPNRFWYFSLVIANKLKLRPYQGLENWQGYSQLRRDFERVGFKVERQYGIHAFPFVISVTHPLLDWLHQFRQTLAPTMVNIAIKASKPAARPKSAAARRRRSK